MRRSLAVGSLAALVSAIAVMALNCGDDKGGNPIVAAADVTIEIVSNSGNMSYSPSVRSVSAGKTVAWHNADNMAHTATADDATFNTGTIAPGATSAPIRMAAADTLGYHCAFHPTMVATLQVTP